MKSVQHCLLILVCILFIQTISNAQSIVTEARADYEIGLIENAKNKLLAGLENETISEKQDRVEAFELLSIIYFDLDSIELGESYANQILLIKPSYDPSTNDPEKFKATIERIRSKPSELQVSSVSKNSENLYEAPATVILVTQEDIEDRGYNDLEELLHDLPGFDISRGNGLTYSTIYLRGYRSANNTRMLFLIDGVEQNDMWSNVIRISRQYPITNIKSVEVVYGPASTIYGANAFLGVVSINTKDPIDINKENGEKNNTNWGVNGQIGMGSYNSKALDLTAAISSKNNENISALVSFRYFESDNNDLSIYDEFNFSGYENNNETRLNYRNSMLVSKGSDSALYADIKLDSNATGYYAESNDTLYPTDVAINEALNLDNKFYDGLNYANKSKSYYLSSKVKIYDFTLGFEYWKKNEGSGAWFTDEAYGNTGTGMDWTTFNMNLYAQYSKDINEQLTFVNLLRFKHNGLNDPTNISSLSTYYNSKNNLLDLVYAKQSHINNSYRDIKSNQLRNESRFIYTPSRKFNMIAAIDVRSSAIQGGYAKSSEPVAEEIGDVPDTLSSNHFFSSDFGLYAQANYFALKNLKLTLGGRVDHNKVRENYGYGWVFNPRVAVVYSPKKYVFKAIFATAFKDPSNFEKYSTLGRRNTINPNLQAERVFNYELSVRRFFGKYLNVELVGYYSRYTDAVQETKIAGTEDYNFDNVGERKVIGAFVNVWYKPSEKLNAYFNYTFTNPKTNTPESEEFIRIADIASHQANIGVNYQLLEDLTINLRSNIVGAKQTGSGTSAPNNQMQFDPYLLFHGSISYSLFNNRLGFQFNVNNIFNAKYRSPGIRAANNDPWSMYFPQNGTNFMLRMIVKF